jgi:hypothetical protein
MNSLDIHSNQLAQRNAEWADEYKLLAGHQVIEIVYGLIS